jgi:uncharacterized membrane protein YadS
VIKLARVCLLAPIVLALAIRHRRYLTSQGKFRETSAKVPFIPFFVIGFVAVAIIQNTFTIAPHVHETVITLSKVLIGSGLVAMGSGVRRRSIRAIGARPMVMGLLAWVIVAGVALFAVRVTGI